MDSDEEQFWWEFKCEFGALLEFWNEKELHEEHFRRIEKQERYNWYLDRKHGWIPSSWILGHEFGTILGTWFVKGLCENREREWQLRKKSLRRERYLEYRSKNLEDTSYIFDHLGAHWYSPRPFPFTFSHTPTPTPTPIPALQGTMDAHKRTIAEFEKTLSPEEAAGLKQIRTERRSVRAQITKTVNKLNAAIASEGKVAIKMFVAELTKIQEKLSIKDEDVWAFLSDDCVIADQAIGAEWSDSVDNALLDAYKILDGTDPSQAPPPSSSPSSQNNSTKARLPKMDLPKFTGKSPSEYQGWWNAFESLIDGRSDLSTVDKLIYLKNCCIEGASGLADGYSLTEVNYEQLKLALKDMYGHPRLIQQSHAENILDLHSFETEGIKPFLTTLETSMRCLAEYGIDMENGAWIIVPIVQKLMPKELAQKWREEIHDDISFSTKKLIEFLHEKMLCYGSAQEQKADRKPKDTRPKTTLMLASTSMTACPCCDQNHRIYKCGKFLKMAPAERRNFAYRNRLCRRCLGPYSPEHLKKCEWKCKKCNDSHNHLLHTGQNEGQGRGKHNSQTHGSRKWQNPQNSRNGNPSKRPYQGQKVEGQKGNPAQAANGGQREDTNAGGSAQGTVVNSLHSTTNHEKMAVLKNFKAVPKEKPNSTVRSLIDDGY